jgi:hypothetical protein
MRSSEIRVRLEEALGKKPGSGAFFSPTPETVRTGISGIDSLSGGIPRGALTEISGARSSGRTSLMLSLFSGLTGNGEVVGLVDPGNAFDPASADAFGVDLERLVWIRAKGLGAVDPVLKILKIADLLLGGGGFGLIAVDLSDLAPSAIRRVPFSVWFRFRRAVEHTPTILLCLSPEPVLGAAALALRLDNRSDQAVRWTAHTLGALFPEAGILRSRHARSSEHRNCQFRLDHPAWIEAGCTEHMQPSGVIS